MSHVLWTVSAPTAAYRLGDGLRVTLVPGDRLALRHNGAGLAVRLFGVWYCVPVRLWSHLVPLAPSPRKESA
jgi:hypothetical protein